MDKELLRKHIEDYVDKYNQDEDKLQEDYRERNERANYYQKWSKDKILKMDKKEFTKYVGKLWASQIWGNKDYMVNKLINNNGFEELKEKLADFVWGDKDLESRWNYFRSEIKGLGPATMSEILCMVYPQKYMVWNRRAYVGLDYLGVPDLPRYNYQCDGEKYQELCKIAQSICEELKEAGLDRADLIMVDFFIWQELQVKSNLTNIHIDEATESTAEIVETEEEYEFIHDEIKQKIEEIGEWLGFTSYTETKVAEGSVVDAVWEATIGNMGRVIYVFEVQTKGSVDGMLMNLLKSLNNPAVQGVVAVSDEEQIEKIKRHANEIKTLEDKLKYWDYKEVMDNHEALSFVNESINKLDLVPKSF